MKLTKRNYRATFILDNRGKTTPLTRSSTA